ncbi:MAG: S1 RNA-binding domain-containing protein [Lachnospiraceae bacterium]|nr:S1 RNA-binding domain-containing protein [Lachnospiraceae bacterium]
MLELGKNQILTVVRKTDHGVYLAEDANPAGDRAKRESEVLLPKKYVPEGAGIGDSIEVFLYKDSSDRLIATTQTPKIRLHETALLKVKAVGRIGAFLDAGLEKDFLLPYAEMTKRPEEGEECLTALYIDKSGRLALTMRVYEYLRTDAPYHKNDDVTGIVYEINERFGAFVAVDCRYSALIPKNELFEDIPVNAIVHARVTQVREDGRLSLSIRDKAYKQMDADAERIMALIESYDGVLPFSDKASPETIRRETGMSKNEFKRAVGRLYKERRILIDKEMIRSAEQIGSE